MINKIHGLKGALLAGLLTAGTLSAAPALAGSVPESDEPIKLAINEWTGQHITTRVAGAILERMGYSVEYVTAGYYPQLTAIRENDVTATLEIWSSNIGENYDKAIDSGKAVELGDLGLDPIETWFYNDAAKAACPGLPDWEALKGCAEVFAAGETFPDGRLLDYPADWGTSNVDRLTALGLPFKSIPAGSEGALIAEIKSAELSKRPLLIMFWTPHWAFAEVTLHPVTLPAYVDGCYEDASVGVNPNATYDCDWLRGRISKVAWVGMEGKWPAAYKLLRNYQLTNDDQIPMMKAVDQDGADLAKVVNDWVDANEAKWGPWVADAKM